MSSNNTSRSDGQDDERTVTTDQIGELADETQEAIDALEGEFPPRLQREIDHLEDAIETIEDWAEDAGPTDTDALVGAPVIVDAEQERIEELETKVGSGQPDVRKKLEAVEDAVETLEDAVDDLTLAPQAYVVYLNGEFVARYSDEGVSVRTILNDADREDPSELGLFPLDGFNGDRQTDQAFPANRELDLSEGHRTFFESTSDGGKIA